MEYSGSSPATRNWLKVNPAGGAMSATHVDSRKMPSAISSSSVFIRRSPGVWGPVAASVARLRGFGLLLPLWTPGQAVWIPEMWGLPIGRGLPRRPPRAMPDARQTRWRSSGGCVTRDLHVRVVRVEAAQRLRRLVPADGWCWSTVDPATLMLTGTGRGKHGPWPRRTSDQGWPPMSCSTTTSSSSVIWCGRRRRLDCLASSLGAASGEARAFVTSTSRLGWVMSSERSWCLAEHAGGGSCSSTQARRARTSHPPKWRWWGAWPPDLADGIRTALLLGDIKLSGGADLAGLACGELHRPRAGSLPRTPAGERSRSSSLASRPPLNIRPRCTRGGATPAGARGGLEWARQTSPHHGS